MNNRYITLGTFVLVTLGLLVVAGLVRSVALDGMQREREGEAGPHPGRGHVQGQG